MSPSLLPDRDAARVAVLCGGVGGSRFLRTLTHILPEKRITAIVNTADDDWFHGLYVSPDPDIITYALAGEVDDERGWGVRDDTFRWLESLQRFGHETWFQIGDRDLATHLHRTRLLHEGSPPSAIVEEIARAFGVRLRLLPMSDDRVRTMVETDAGDLPFQEFLVKRHAQDRVRAVRFEGGAAARPAPGVLDALASATVIALAPSNPAGSILPILSVPQVRAALLESRARRVAVSPIIGGASLQPPAAEMMAGLGYSVDVHGVADIYAGLIDSMVIDPADRDAAPALERRGLRVIVAPLLMRTETERRAAAAGLRAVFAGS